MTYAIYQSQVDALGFDLGQSVAEFMAAVDAHRFTIDVPAPTAHPVVEIIVRSFGGDFEVLPDPEPEPEPEPDPDAVPEWISPLQARRALRAAGLLAAVQQAVAQAGEEAEEAWEYAVQIRRDDPLLLGVAVHLGMTEEQLDDLFRAALAY